MNRMSRSELFERTDWRRFYGQRLEAFRPNGAANSSARCPFHPDKTPSMSVNVENGMFSCKACGAEGSGVDFLVKHEGLSVGEAFRVLEELAGAPPGQPPPKRTRTRVDAPHAKGLNGQPEAGRYRYSLEGGSRNALKIRFGSGDGKTFSWYEADAGGFLVGLDGAKPDLYRLFQVTEAKERGAVILLNEGERAADLATDWDGDESLDFVATCGPNGAESFKRENEAARLLEPLHGARIWAVVDRDDAGQEWASHVARELAGKARELRFLEPQTETPKADLADDLEAGLSIRGMADVTDRFVTPPPRLDSWTVADILARPDEPIPWQFEPYLAAGDNHMIAAAAGDGKSMMLLHLAVAAAAGLPLFGTLKPQGRPWRVLCLDEEQPAYLIAKRLRKILRGLKLPERDAGDLPIRYAHQRRLNLTKPEKLDLLLREVDDFEPDLVIGDALVRFTGKLDPNRAEDMAEFFATAVRPLNVERGVATLWAHHRKKPPTARGSSLDPKDAVRGSTELVAGVSNLWVLDRDRVSDNRTLHHAKCRPAMEEGPVGLNFIDDEDGGLRIEAVSVAGELETLIRQWLTDAGTRGLLRSEIVDCIEELGITRDTASKQASRWLKRLGAISKKQGKHSRYWLKHFAPQEAA